MKSSRAPWIGASRFLPVLLAGAVLITLATAASAAKKAPAKKAGTSAASTTPPTKSQPATAAQGAGPGQRALENYLAKRSFVHVGLQAVWLKDGAVLASRDPQTPMQPASVHKLATSAVVMSVLGSEFKFTTTLATLGEDLLVVGDGDPTLGDPIMASESGGTIYDVPDAWVAKLKELKITAIKGKIIVDDGIFEGGRNPDWPRGQESTWYSAPVSGLNFNDNCLDISVRRTGASVSAELSPASQFMDVINRLTAGSKDTYHMRLANEDRTVTLLGQVKSSSSSPQPTAINEPALLFGRVLADRLVRGGIQFSGSIERRVVVGPDRKLPAEAKVVAQHATPVAAALARANKRSLNMTAENLLQRATAQVTGRATFADGRRVATAVLVKSYGVNENELTISDGCGLSHANRVSPNAMVTLMRGLVFRPDANVFLSSLSVAGVDGTLHDRFKPYAGRILGKTGTIDGVSTLAGFILDKQNVPAVAFAIFCNDTRGTNWQARAVQDALVIDWLSQVDARTPAK